MHDLDRTLQELESGIDALETDEYELDGDWAWEGEGDYGEELEEAFEGGYEGELEGVAVFEIEEMELAATLLEIQDEEELEQFLGKLVKKAGRAVGKVVRSPVDKAENDRGGGGRIAALATANGCRDVGKWTDPNAPDSALDRR